MSTSGQDPSGPVGMLAKTRPRCVKSPTPRTYAHLGPSTHLPQLLALPPSVSAWSQLYPPISAVASMLPPSPPAPSPDAAAGAGGRVSALTTATRGPLRRHGWTHTLEPDPPLSGSATPRTEVSQTLPAQAPHQSPGQGKTRASASRENVVISRYFLLSAPPPESRRREIWRNLAFIRTHLADLGRLLRCLSWENWVLLLAC